MVSISRLFRVRSAVSPAAPPASGRAAIGTRGAPFRQRRRQVTQGGDDAHAGDAASAAGEAGAAGPELGALGQFGA